MFLPMVTCVARPGRTQVHERPASDDTHRKLGPAGRTDPAVVRDHGLTTGALGSVGTGILKIVFVRILFPK